MRRLYYMERTIGAMVYVDEEKMDDWGCWDDIDWHDAEDIESTSTEIKSLDDLYSTPYDKGDCPLEGSDETILTLLRTIDDEAWATRRFLDFCTSDTQEVITQSETALALRGRPVEGWAIFMVGGQAVVESEKRRGERPVDGGPRDKWSDEWLHDELRINAKRRELRELEARRRD